jgi:hypothetical protein
MGGIGQIKGIINQYQSATPQMRSQTTPLCFINRECHFFLTW